MYIYIYIHITYREVFVSEAPFRDRCFQNDTDTTNHTKHNNTTTSHNYITAQQQPNNHTILSLKHTHPNNNYGAITPPQ